MAGYVKRNSVMAHDVQSLNRRGVFPSANVDNGNVYQLLTQSTDADKSLVWVATAPSAVAGLTELWMSSTEGVVSIVSPSGKVYKGLDNDFVNDFTNIAGEIIEFFQPRTGDVIELTDSAIGGTKGANTFIVATSGQSKLQWASAGVTGLTLQYIRDSFVSVGTGDIASQRVVTRKFVVTATK